jgi:photosystem II stability/assembly factor-like uncharacterized protein
MRMHFLSLMVCLPCFLLPALVWGGNNPIELPAKNSALAARSTLLAVAHAGNRIVAAGLRGHIVLSDDDGATWRQAKVPVSVDLTGLSFPTASHGWAVGHGGVVLDTRDGGETWTCRLAGKQAAQIAVDYYKGRPEPSVEERRALKQAKAQLAQVGEQPFLDVFFENETTGFVVGAFNGIFRTEDGGKSWVPWMDRTGNPEELHFYSVKGREGRVFLAGEQGKVWRLQGPEQRFISVATPYTGTLFDMVVANESVVVAYGMRGSLYRSADAGTTWKKVESGTAAGITAGTIQADGRIVLVNQAGGLHVSVDQGKTFVSMKLENPMPYNGVTQAGTVNKGTIVLIGALGAARHVLP